LGLSILSIDISAPELGRRKRIFHEELLEDSFPAAESNAVSFGAFATNKMIHLVDFIDFFAKISFTPVKLYDPKIVVDDALAYAMPPIITFCTAAVSWKILLHFINSAKGN
jgi:hypothetical protein